MDDFERVLQAEYTKELKRIQNRCREIVIDEIDKQVYDKYEPTVYKRTGQLRDNVRAEIRGEILYVYINTGNMHYEDFHGNDVTSLVPFWVNDKHNSNNHSRFMLFQYPTRGFMQTAKVRIEQELEVEVTIMREGF